MNMQNRKSSFKEPLAKCNTLSSVYFWYLFRLSFPGFIQTKFEAKQEILTNRITLFFRENWIHLSFSTPLFLSRMSKPQAWSSSVRLELSGSIRPWAMEWFADENPGSPIMSDIQWCCKLPFCSDAVLRINKSRPLHIILIDVASWTENFAECKLNVAPILISAFSFLRLSKLRLNAWSPICFVYSGFRSLCSFLIPKFSSTPPHFQTQLTNGSVE